MAVKKILKLTPKQKLAIEKVVLKIFQMVEKQSFFVTLDPEEKEDFLIKIAKKSDLRLHPKALTYALKAFKRQDYTG